MLIQATVVKYLFVSVHVRLHQLGVVQDGAKAGRRCQRNLRVISGTFLKFIFMKKPLKRLPNGLI